MSRVVQEWRITGDPNRDDMDDSTYPWYVFVWPRPSADRYGEDPDDGEAEARKFWTRVVLGRRGGQLPEVGPWKVARLEHRTVTYQEWDEVETCPSDKETPAPSGADGSGPPAS